MPLPKLQERFTYQDYLTWSDDERWEIIDGEPTMMSPAPTPTHQTIVFNFSRILGNALIGKPSRGFISPIDVVLSDYDIVQPDLIVVCDPAKITDKCIRGAPDLVIEILSPSTSLRDRREKKRLYEKYGVKEYILVYPESQTVERFYLGADGFYLTGEIFGAQEILSLKSLPGIDIPLWEVFGIEKKPEDASKTNLP